MVKCEIPLIFLCVLWWVFSEEERVGVPESTVDPMEKPQDAVPAPLRPSVTGHPRRLGPPNPPGLLGWAELLLVFSMQCQAEENSVRGAC